MLSWQSGWRGLWLRLREPACGCSSRSTRRAHLAAKQLFWALAPVRLQSEGIAGILVSNRTCRRHQPHAKSQLPSAIRRLCPGMKRNVDSRCESCGDHHMRDIDLVKQVQSSPIVAKSPIHLLTADTGFIACTGSGAEREAQATAAAAWGAMRRFLEGGPGGPSAGRLRAAAADAILATEPRFRLPAWLLQLFQVRTRGSLSAHFQAVQSCLTAMAFVQMPSGSVPGSKDENAQG